MEVIIITSLLGWLLSFLDSRKVLKNGMLLGFLLITVIQAFRYGCGNDYMNYFRDFTMLESRGLSAVHNSVEEINMEPGWVVVNVLFQYFGGFYVFIAFISFMQNIIMYGFIRHNVSRKWWALSFFIYVFTTTTGYLINMTMIRQGFAISLFVLAYPWFRDGKFWFSVPWVFLLSTIHQSALVLLPLCFVSYLKVKPFFLGLFFGLAFISLILATQLLKDVLQTAYTLSSFERFEKYEDSDEGSLGFGVFVKSIPFIVSIFFFIINKQLTNNERILVIIACLYYLVLPFDRIINIVERTGYYFLSLNVVVVPILYSKLKRGVRFVLLCILVSFTLFTYYFFFDVSKSIYAPYYLHYQTIFDHL